MSALFPQLREYVEARCGETESILPKRRTDLDALAAQLRSLLGQGTKLELLFICTHNSRRSHMGQVWAQVAAQHFGIDGVQTWSGGTEVTAFAPGAIAALQRAGLRIDIEKGERHVRAETPSISSRVAKGSSPSAAGPSASRIPRTRSWASWRS
jgi:arsenate reductase